MQNATANAPAIMNAQAEFIRLPRIGERCPLTGLSRSKLNQLILPCKENKFRPPVRSKSLKTNPYQVKGVRLIFVESLLSYIREA